jgi:Mg-chelatase subunit ChlD
MPKLIPLVLLLCLLGLAGESAGEDSFAAARDEFLMKIYDDLEAVARMELVDRLAGFDSRDAAKVLLESLVLLGDKIDRVLGDLAKLEKAHERLNTNQDVEGDDFERRNSLRKRILEVDVYLSAERGVIDRILAGLSGFKNDSAQAVVVKTVTKGKVWRQRALSGRAAAIYPTDQGRRAALKALEDKEPPVVIHTLIGLTERKDPETVKAVAECLLHEAWVAQSIAAEALAAIGSKKGIRPLIEAIPQTDGRVQDDINEALKKLTGENYAPDYELWKQWYEEHRAEIEEEEGKPLGGGGQAEPKEPTDYYGIKSRSKRIVYVIDTSGSMEKEIRGGEAVTPKPGEKPLPSGPKIEIAKSELKNAIRQLPDDAYFNIITFNHLVHRWEKEMVKASQKNKNAAYKFVRRLKPKGSTYTYGALKEAFKLAGMGARDPQYDSGVDTIFLLSDGAPTDQTFPTSKPMDPEIILKAVKEWNQLRKVVIHAIAIDPQISGKAFIRFMRDLARQNGGQYTERG